MSHNLLQAADFRLQSLVYSAVRHDRFIIDRLKPYIALWELALWLYNGCRVLSVEEICSPGVIRGGQTIRDQDI
jgi:hypothetical protein